MNNFNLYKTFGQVSFLQSPIFGEWKKESGQSIVIHKIKHDNGNYEYVQCIGYKIPYLGTAWAAYGGPLGDTTKEFINSLKDLCIKNAEDTFMIRVQSPIKGFINAKKFKTSFSQPLRECVVKINYSKEKRIDSYSKNNRKLIRRYERDEELVECKVITKDFEKHKEDVYKLLSNTASERNFSLHAKKTYDSLLSVINKNIGSGYLTIGYLKGVGDPHSCAITCINNKEAYHIFAGSDKKGYETHLPVLVAHEAMSHAMSLGCNTYNLGGVGDSDKDLTSSLAIFKQNIGGRIVLNADPYDLIINKKKYYFFKISKNPFIRAFKRIIQR